MVKTDEIIMQNTDNKNTVTAWSHRMNEKVDHRITNYVS
jgi:hypothetical protein